MIVIVRKTLGGSWQGLAPEAPDNLPKAIWHGSRAKVEASFRRHYRTSDIQFIDLAYGWDDV